MHNSWTAMVYIDQGASSESGTRTTLDIAGRPVQLCSAAYDAYRVSHESIIQTIIVLSEVGTARSLSTCRR